MEKEGVLDVQTDEEWNDAYSKFEAKFDKPRDEESRKPSKRTLYWMLSMVFGIAGAALAVTQHNF